MAMARGGPPPPPGPMKRGGPPAPSGAAKPKPAPAKQAPPPKPAASSGGFDSVLGQLSGRIGAPKESGNESNPSQGARPGYKAPEGLPKGGGTLGTEKCFWSLSGPQVAQVQTEVDFKLLCKNEKKEPWDVDPRLLETEMWRPDNKERTMIRGKINKEPPTGQYCLTFRPQQPGEYVFNIWVKGELEKKAIYQEGKEVPLKVIKEPTLTESEVYFTASGHGLNGGQVGKESVFDIWSKDASNQPQQIDVSLLTVTVSAGLKKLSGHVEYLDVGHYQATFTPQSPGEVDVCVCYGSEEIIRKTIAFTFGIDPSKTKIVDPPTNVKVGKQATFLIQAKSQMGSDLNYGGQKFDCAVSGPPKGVTGLVVRDETNGKYTTRFTLITPGTYKFFVKLSGVPLDGSPFTVIAE